MTNLFDSLLLQNICDPTEFMTWLDSKLHTVLLESHRKEVEECLQRVNNTRTFDRCYSEHPTKDADLEFHPAGLFLQGDCRTPEYFTGHHRQAQKKYS
jgi:hypothetical protein